MSKGSISVLLVSNSDPAMGWIQGGAGTLMQLPLPPHTFASYSTQNVAQLTGMAAAFLVRQC